MYITELIAALQVIKVQYGDIQCRRPKAAVFSNYPHCC